MRFPRYWRKVAVFSLPSDLSRSICSASYAACFRMSERMPKSQKKLMRQENRTKVKTLPLKPSKGALSRLYMNSLGDTVYLKASPEVLAAHLRMARVERPLIKGKTNEELLAYIRESLREREPYYSQAKHILDVNLLDNYEKIETSVRLLRNELGV